MKGDPPLTHARQYDRTRDLPRPKLYSRPEHIVDVAIAFVFGAAVGALAALIIVGNFG